MFDELKESYNGNYFKVIRRLKSLQKAEAYLELKRASIMELLREYRNRSCITDVPLNS